MEHGILHKGSGATGGRQGAYRGCQQKNGSDRGVRVMGLKGGGGKVTEAVNRKLDLIEG